MKTPEGAIKTVDKLKELLMQAIKAGKDHNLHLTWDGIIITFPLGPGCFLEDGKLNGIKSSRDNTGRFFTYTEPNWGQLIVKNMPVFNDTDYLFINYWHAYAHVLKNSVEVC